MIVLWTDALIFALIAILTGLSIYLRGQEPIRRPLKKVAGSKSGMISLAILSFFIIIGLLDSVHFRS
ncbi:MAG: ABC transporter permease, partial [Methylosarcina sp.]